jgi:hypothetical protein
LIPDSARSEALDLLQRATTPASDFGRFNIGYVSGNKSFFHPTADVIQDFDLPVSSLRPSIADARSLRKSGAATSRLDGDSLLWIPDDSDLSSGELDYIRHGEASGVDQAYKCSIRDPWYVVPYVKVPDVVISVFGDRPILLVNDSGSAASNSMICGFLDGDAKEFATRWYTSLTSLSVELEVHSLGGGVLVLVPNEASRVRVLASKPVASGFARADHALLHGSVSDAYAIRDTELIRKYGSSAMNAVFTATEALKRWRTKTTPNMDCPT